MRNLSSMIIKTQTLLPLYSESVESASSLSQGAVAKPSLVFLHGLLGSTQDWQQIVSHLSPDYQCICIDLPGHAGSQAVTANDFQHVQQLIIATLAQYELEHIVFVGYSLGARIAMHIASEPAANWPYSIDGMLLESGNPGLNSSAEQLQRGLHDLGWVTRFSEAPLSQVLPDWYQQGVFASLTNTQKTALIATRSHIQADYNGFNGGKQISKMLAATSLSKQGYLLPQLQDTAFPVCMVCGELDPKFVQLTQASQLDHHVVADAGHNVHADQPIVFSALVRGLVSDSIKNKAAQQSAA
ncbi:2-succinyl-6-hydroxy-2,4-cyclohexadiene-1-carboxylate synthase [Moritella sp. Urea-trap-13]|uniref:2-succinyl-6-hydroxy-2, 4-cyclohexadiene-1-carboxylate synthase n=1 Tax=Moritella sp. Urea-trap-13 TaxID=2058327 RepID=UPI000C31C9AC|nr:2-succinyl-6-hydroxy-2,4-cyclohexadiene-1-carboxylate synthase [Moritella sp. Urea-trap-13]PKH07483.1 2-succinyl-6-hydroxy-2,4-cyclohexadiene-1-carboxylate synthase [Moritella sp. Urea-trap-13]